MNKQLKIVAWLIFIVAFFVPVWSVSIATSGLSSDTQQYDGVQTLVMGVYNLAFIVPALIFLLLGRKNPTFYVISVVLSIISVVSMCVWAFGGGR